MRKYGEEAENTGRTHGAIVNQSCREREVKILTRDKISDGPDQVNENIKGCIY